MTIAEHVTMESVAGYVVSVKSRKESEGSKMKKQDLKTIIYEQSLAIALKDKIIAKQDKMIDGMIEKIEMQKQELMQEIARLMRS